MAIVQTLSLVRATVAAVEAELRLERLHPVGPRVVAGQWAHPQLDVLDRRQARLSSGPTSTVLSARHSEMLVLLAECEDGLTAGELAVALSEAVHSPVTIRAELSRLRHLLGPIRLGVPSLPAE